MKKIILLALCVLVVLSTFVSCGALGSYSVNEKTVMTVGGVEVSYDMFKFCYNMAFDEMGAELDYTKEENLVKLRKSAEESVRLYCIQEILFDKYGITITRDDKKAIDAEIQSYIDEQGGKTEYKKWLSENYISGKFFRRQIERMYYLDPYLREVLFTGIDNVIKMDDKTVIDDVKTNFYRYTQIFVSCGEDDNYLEKRMEIDSAYDSLREGSKFSDVALEYSDWTVNTERGVYTTKGEKFIELEEAALKLDVSPSLDEGSYSEIIETVEGFHIIKRLELKDDYIANNLDDLAYISATRRYNEMLKSEADKLEISYTEYYHTLSHEELIKVEYA